MEKNILKDLRKQKMKVLTNKKYEELLNEERKTTFQKIRVILAQINFEAQQILENEKCSKKAKKRLERIIGLISQNM